MLGDDLGEDHVGILILYCPDDISIVMSIWWWLLSQTIFHGHSLKAFLKSCNDNHIFGLNAKRTISVKNKNTFHKKKRKALDVNVLVSRIDKLLSKESI